MDDRQAYRRYLICTHPWTGHVSIEKCGTIILRDAGTVANAKREIDALLD